MSYNIYNKSNNLFNNQTPQNGNNNSERKISAENSTNKDIYSHQVEDSKSNSNRNIFNLFKFLNRWIRLLLLYLMSLV